MSKSDLAVCGYCLEPVTNPLCPSCISKSVEKWLEKEGVSKGLITSVKEDIENSLVDSKDNKELCIKCSKENERVVCPYCFINEIYAKLKPLDWIRAEKLKILFNFGGPEHGELEERIVSDNVIPLTDEWEEHRHENACENCENHSLFLDNRGGRWLCERCREIY